MILIWHDGPGGYHLAEAGDERALCSVNIRNADTEAKPDREACCTRCEILAEIAGAKVPPSFRKRNGEGWTGQRDLL